MKIPILRPFVKSGPLCYDPLKPMESIPKVKKYYRKVGRTAKYLAAPVPGVFDAYPSWFAVLIEAGSLRTDDDGMLWAKLITGAWEPAYQGQMVVLQQGGDVYLVDVEDFNKLWSDWI